MGFYEATEQCSGVLLPCGEMKKKTVTGSMTHDHDDVSENAAGLWSRVLPVYCWVVAPTGTVL
jgi:hypothetical protein